MPTPEEERLIRLRREWADFPILNYWHETNDAPDSFFDEALEQARGQIVEVKPTREVRRDQTEEVKAKSSYSGRGGSGAKIGKTLTKKGWGKFYPVIAEMGKNNWTSLIPTRAQRATDTSNQACTEFVITKGLDMIIGYGAGAKTVSAFEKGPVSGTSKFTLIDRKCNRCGGGWTIQESFKDKDNTKKCPVCRSVNDYTDVKGPYKTTGDVLLAPVGLVGEGQTVALMLLTGREAKKIAGLKLKPGDKVCFRGFIKGQGYDARVVNGLGLSGSGLGHYGYSFTKGPTMAVPLLTLGDKSKDGFIKNIK